ncbi:MAG: metallophosphoesterase [Succinivibrio sp.]
MTAFILHPFIMALIICSGFIAPLNRVPKSLKLILMIIATAFSLKIFIFVFTGGTLMDAKLSRIPAIIATSGYFTCIFVCLLTIVRVLVNTLYRISRLSIKKYVIPAGSLRYAFIIISVSLYLGVIGVINGFAPPSDTSYSLNVNRLSDRHDNFKIVLLSDLHISIPTTKDELLNIVRRVNEKKPDLIVIAGDFVDGSVSELACLTDLLKDLSAKYGVYAASGNHEFYSGYSEWLSYFEKLNIHFLENSSAIIRDNEGRGILNLCGLMDVAAPRFGFSGPDIDKAVEQTDRQLPTVFIAHQPKLAHELTGLSDLTLCGHTHGGLMPGLKQIVSSANGDLVSGFYQLLDQKVIVSNGTRIWAGVPLRIDTPSEIVTIELKSVAKGSG